MAVPGRIDDPQGCNELIAQGAKIVLRQNPAKVTIKRENVLAWLGNGAQPSDTVKNILSREGIIKEFAESKKAK